MTDRFLRSAAEFIYAYRVEIIVTWVAVVWFLTGAYGPFQP